MFSLEFKVKDVEGKATPPFYVLLYIYVHMSYLISEMYVFFLYLIVSWIRAKMQKQKYLSTAT